ncbi:CBS domain-containing protein [Halovenus aranensis]|jgi:CBS domain-containing protein|uniref:CBS domain-containing protein n=1 Tax=Halovenus aranensis TaxID=890420 RepID=A0A1G8TLR1_9EURY|nr:CBS domain-containing protein [Halovenus aranensis]SDJ42471.1 CBS domain-containing protein [Halovenus aranensis]
MAVIDIARTNVVTVGPGESVAAVIRRMHGEAVGSVVVVDDEEPLGLVSDRDLAMAVLDETFDAEETDIVEVVDEETPTIEGDAGVYDLVELLSQKGLRRVPVVEDGELAGIISLSDVVVLLGMELQHVGTAIRSSSPAYERSGMEYYHD